MSRTIGPYELHEELASGGMGTVFRAMGPIGPVAVKVLRTPTLDPRFARELKAQGQLQHPGIVRLHDGGVDPGGRGYMVMELVEGGSLQDRLDRHGAFPPEVAVEIGLELCEALAYAHARGVLHRDLKPANVMRDAEGVIKLADFGLAKLTDLESLTRSGTIVGTPSYMAPEQADGDRERLGVATDVYGLGATLYALVCGRPPFRGGSTLTLLKDVLLTPPPPPSRFCPGLDPDFERLLLRCLAKDPAQRFPSVDALREALSSLSPAPVVVVSRRVSFPLAALALAILAGGVATAGWIVAESRQAQARRARLARAAQELEDLHHRTLAGDDQDAATQALLAQVRAELPGAGDSPSAELLRGFLALEAEDCAGAIAHLERATQLDPRRPYPWALLAWSRLELHLDALDPVYAQVREELERALSLEPDHLPALFWLAELTALRDPTTCLRTLERLAELCPNRASVYAKRARQRGFAGDLPGALADMDRALELAPEDAELYLMRGAMLASVERLDEATADAARAEALGDDNAELWLLRADIHLGRREVAECLEALERALLLEPDNTQAAFRRANLLRARGQTEAALRQLDALDDAASGRGWPAVLWTKADILVQLGRLDEAEKTLRRAEEVPHADVYRAQLEQTRQRLESARRSR